MQVARIKPIAIGVILIVITGGANCSRHDKGGEREMNDNVAVTIREINIDDDAGLDNLATVIRDKSWNDPRKIVEMLHTGDKDQTQKAAGVLLALGDLALTPLLDSIDGHKPEDKVWDMEQLVDIQLDNRTRIVRILDEMLKDKQILEDPELPPDVEEKPIPRRVCDEAYLMMRRLFALEENEGEYFDNSDTFIELFFEERDAEIERVQKTKKWISLIDQMESEEE